MDARLNSPTSCDDGPTAIDVVSAEGTRLDLKISRSPCEIFCLFERSLAVALRK